MQGGFKPFHVFGWNQTDLKGELILGCLLPPPTSHGTRTPPTPQVPTIPRPLGSLFGGPHASVSSGDGEAETDGKGKKSESAPCHHFLAMER